MAAAQPVAGDDSGASHVATTARYEFHSNFWLNLHHFLYRQAQRDDGRVEGGRSLSREEFQDLNGAVTWYREQFAGRSLLMDEELYAVKRALVGFGPQALPEHDAISSELRTRLEAAAPVYRARYWPRHDAQNRAMFAWNEARIRALESTILDRIADLAEQPWPDGLIRVDLSWDANWAGAYCTTNPTHAVMTSRPGGPDNTWPPGGWFELLFHEPSHALIAPDRYAVARAIATAADNLGVEAPEQLWHGVLFYFSGTAVREALAGQGIEHALLMDEEDIFARYHAALFAELPAYVTGEASLEAAMSKVLAALD